MAELVHCTFRMFFFLAFVAFVYIPAYFRLSNIYMVAVCFPSFRSFTSFFVLFALCQSICTRSNNNNGQKRRNKFIHICPNLNVNVGVNTTNNVYDSYNSYIFKFNAFGFMMDDHSHAGPFISIIWHFQSDVIFWLTVAFEPNGKISEKVVPPAESGGTVLDRS